jgi:hypothetical protein
MNEYIHAFENGLNCLPANCDLTGLYGRITRGVNDDDFLRLSRQFDKRLSWVFDHETLRSFLSMSHLEMLVNSGHTIEWIRHQLSKNQKFKLIIFSVPPDEVTLATWDNIFELLLKVYPEIDPNVWSQYADQLKQMTIDEIDPESLIARYYYQGEDTDEYMNTNRFLNLKEQPTLLQIRAFLHHQIGLNELFSGNGRTVTHQGVLVDKEYLTRNRPLNEFNRYKLLDLNPVLP